MAMTLIDLGGSRSFPDTAALRGLATAWRGTLILGGDAAARAQALAALDTASQPAIAIELQTECLGVHLGEREDSTANVVGFSRFRLGRADATDLVEIVRAPATAPSVLSATRALFEAMGLSPVVCTDRPGRIVDALLRPYLNAALASVDEGLASPPDMDLALRLGLGHPQGPNELLRDTGLEAHFQVSSELYAALGTAEFHPARKASVCALHKAIGLA